MGKPALFSAALSVLVMALLPVHQHLVAQFGNADWLNMAFGLPIGLATALNIDIIVHKIRPLK